jgi:hypothetical protein
VVFGKCNVMLFHSSTVFRKEVISSKNNFVDFSVAKSIYDNGFSVKSIYSLS